MTGSGVRLGTNCSSKLHNGWLLVFEIPTLFHVPRNLIRRRVATKIPVVQLAESAEHAGWRMTVWPRASRRFTCRRVVRRHCACRISLPRVLDRLFLVAAGDLRW